MNKGHRAVAARRQEAGWNADLSAPRGENATEANLLRTVSHDLKGPLTAIRGYAQLLQLRATRQDRASDVKAAATIVEQVQRMTAMLDELLDAAQALDGHLALMRAPLDLEALAHSAVDAARRTAPAQSLVVRAAEPDLSVEGDAMRLGRVLDSLLATALKAAPPGGQVEVTVRRQGPEILVAIGGGDAAAALAEVPKTAQRASSRQPGAAAPLDLATYVSRRIVEAHGGRFWAGPSVRGGMEFAFTLRARTSRTGAPRA